MKNIKFIVKIPVYEDDEIDTAPTSFKDIECRTQLEARRALSLDDQPISAGLFDRLVNKKLKFKHTSVAHLKDVQIIKLMYGAPSSEKERKEVKASRRDAKKEKQINKIDTIINNRKKLSRSLS